MRQRKYSTGSLFLRLLLLALTLGAGRPADALDPVSIGNLQAAMRTLGFLESLPAQGPIVVGVIYAPEIPGAQALAAETAATIGAMHGPNSRMLLPVVLSATDLNTFHGRCDVIFLTAGVSRQPERILGAMGRLHLVSISDDPLCIAMRCCVLLVRTGQRVEISLNTSLAAEVGARFSMVFMMVVKRR
jgi:hypothetical protein